MSTEDRVRCGGRGMVRMVVEGGGDGGGMRVTVDMKVEGGRRMARKHFTFLFMVEIGNG